MEIFTEVTKTNKKKRIMKNYSYVIIQPNYSGLRQEKTLLHNKYNAKKKYAFINKITHKDGSENIAFIDYSNDLQNGLLRPYFIDFINFCKKNYKPCLFYINTKSTTKWANVIVKNIENVCKIKFSKPIFTREDTILNEKSLKSLIDLLSIKYNLLFYFFLSFFLRFF